MVSVYSEVPNILARIAEIDRVMQPRRGGELIALQLGAEDSRLDRFKKLPRFTFGPTYRYLLSLHDGIDNFYWSGARLVSTQSLLETPDYDAEHQQPDMFVFVLGPERRSLAFDRMTLRNNGEMAVVEFDATGERARWPTLTAFLWHYVEREEAALAAAEGGAQRQEPPADAGK
jgi:hypothetical protein